LKRHQIILRLAQVWIVALIVVSLQPARPGPVVALHRAIHWVAFAGVALLLLLLSRTRRHKISGVAVTCLLALSLEALQHFIYRNPMEWRDVRDDVLAIMAVLLVYTFAGFPNRHGSPPEPAAGDDVPKCKAHSPTGPAIDLR
jgi:hypothetical protein